MVFKTVAENVKSFFQKEEVLEKEPKKAPDAAIELYEGNATVDHKIVDHKLGGTPLPTAPPEEKPTLPYSSQQLRSSLPKQAPASQSMPPEIDISSQIAEFEQAISTIPGEEHEPEHPVEHSTSVAAPVSRQHPGYFDSLGEQLKAGGYDTSLIDGALSQMKTHHARHAATAEHQKKTENLELALTHKLAELQALERDWASKREEIVTTQERVAHLECEIAERTAELKGLVASMQEHVLTKPEPKEESPEHESSEVRASASIPSDTSPPVPALEIPPENKVPQPPKEARSTPVTPPESPKEEMSEPAIDRPKDQRFLLANGARLGTLGELRQALLAMDEATYYHHVTPERNDFASWIEGVFGEQALAEKARHVRNRYELAKLLEN